MKNLDPLFDKVLRVTNLIYFLSGRTVQTVYEDSKAQLPSVLDWLRGEGRWARLLYAVCLGYSFLHLTALLVLKIKPTPPITDLNALRAWETLAHALIILFAAILIFKDKSPATLDAKNSSLKSGRDKEKAEDALKRASSAVYQFLKYWPFVWSFWFLLYISLSAYHFLHNPQNLWFFDTIFNALNNATALILYSMYYELSERTVGNNKPENLWSVLSLFLVLIAFAEFFLSKSYSGNEQTLGSIHLAFGILSGLLTGIATALLTARFASPIIGVPPLAIVILALYSVIQPLFPMLSEPKPNPAETIWGYIAVSIALYGKATLLVVIHWARYTHRLTYYMVRGLQMLEEEGPARLVFVNEFLPKDKKIVGPGSVEQNKDASPDEENKSE